MQQAVLLLLLLEFAEPLLQVFFQTFDQSLVLALGFGNLDFGFVQNFVFDFEAVALHADSEPGLEGALHPVVLVVLIRPFLHSPDVQFLVGVGFPGLEEVLLVVLLIEVFCDILDLITFLLNFSIQ